MVATSRYRFVCGWLVALSAGLPACRSKNIQPAPTKIASAAGTGSGDSRSAENRPVAESPSTHGAHEPSAVGSEIIDQLKIAGLSVSETKQFLDTLKTRSAQGDRPGVCSLVSYPLDVHSKHGSHKVATESACRAMYNRIFSAPVLGAISGQRLDELFANSNGVSIGDGAIWFSGICVGHDCRHRTIRIISVNN